MDALINFLIDWGYVGMFIAALLAGSAFPFSSEVVLAALLHPVMGLNPVTTVLSASAGNVLGSLTCYWVGRLGKITWLVKYFHLKEEKIIQMQNYLNGRSAFMAFFSFLPIIGTLISVALGFLRSNVYAVGTSMFIGKLLRYIIVAMAALGLFNSIG